jgi:protein-serine/threonine kinase
MTQLFSSSSQSAALKEKRTFSGQSVTTNKSVNNTASQRIKAFFRINTDPKDQRDSQGPDAVSTQKSEKSSFRQSRFLPHIGRSRSTTVASEGNMLDNRDDAISPTANANPYFIHQGPPALRHHNDGSVPPSPPDTPKIMTTNVNGVSGANDQATTAGKEELARKLRRVASAPNAQGLFSKAKTDDRPSTAEMGKEPIIQHANTSTLSMVEAAPGGHLLPIPASNGSVPSPGQIRQAVAFRRTYSSNSIKVRNVEVGPASFDKIKLIGKGDVGKVYLVREKKSSRLYAMKGEFGGLASYLLGADIQQFSVKRR